MKRAKKFSAISIHDHPRNNYRAYWEYGVTQSIKGSFDWWARFLAYGDGRVITESSGLGFETEDAARESAQAWIAQNVGMYRREVPLEEITDARAQELVDKFDECRRVATTNGILLKDRARAFAGIDQIRGLLRANGIALDEEQSINYNHKTNWHRMGG